MLPTLRAVLDLPVLREAAPEILGGAGRLDHTVRWVHISELLDIPELLSGGELVLTTGLELDKEPDRAASYIRSLEEAGVAGLVVEITGGREGTTAALRSAARGARLPVIMVTRRVRFVEVTEVVHRMIVAEQLERVERARDVHESFTMLSLENAPAGEIVTRTAELIGAPVVLEDVSHQVVAFAPQGVPAAELLRDWEGRSRLAHFREETVRVGEESWLQTPVGLRGQRWGRLVAPVLGVTELEDEAAMVLERAGQALSINRMAERDQRELGYQARAGLLHELRQPRSLDEAEALGRAAALGLKAAAYYLPVVLRLERGLVQDPMELQRRERVLLELLHKVLAATRTGALAASLQAGSIAVLLSVPARQLEDPLLERITAELAERLPAAEELRWLAGVGHARRSLLDAAAGLDEAAQLAETAGTARLADKRFYRAADVRLRGLLALLREDARARTFADAELAGILGPDADAGDLDLLERFLECGGNKAELARKSYQSRPTLYARLARLEERLGLPLDDAESRTSLHVAVLLQRLRGS